MQSMSCGLHGPEQRWAPAATSGWMALCMWGSHQVGWGCRQSCDCLLAAPLYRIASCHHQDLVPDLYSFSHPSTLCFGYFLLFLVYVYIGWFGNWDGSFWLGRGGPMSLHPTFLETLLRGLWVEPIQRHAQLRGCQQGSHHQFPWHYAAGGTYVASRGSSGGMRVTQFRIHSHAARTFLQCIQ